MLLGRFLQESGGPGGFRGHLFPDLLRRYSPDLHLLLRTDPGHNPSPGKRDRNKPIAEDADCQRSRSDWSVEFGLGLNCIKLDLDGRR